MKVKGRLAVRTDAALSWSETQFQTSITVAVANLGYGFDYSQPPER